MSGPLELSSYGKENTGGKKTEAAVSQKTQIRGKLRRLSWEEIFSVETENVGFLLEFA